MPLFLKPETANRIGFFVLGLANNFVFVIMLSASFDLLAQWPISSYPPNNEDQQPEEQAYCNAFPTSVIPLVSIIPSLAIRIIEPQLLVPCLIDCKIVMIALLSSLAFIAIEHIAQNPILIFIGVCLGAFSSGLGESTFLSITPYYGGQVSQLNWFAGSSAASSLSSLVYAKLRMALSMHQVMLFMPALPVTLLVVYYLIITKDLPQQEAGKGCCSGLFPKLTLSSTNNSTPTPSSTIVRFHETLILVEEFDLRSKMHHLVSLIKYWLPLMLGYFFEYFICYCLIELVYYPVLNHLDHAVQYCWFQVAYRFGAKVAYSTIELVQFKHIWILSLLQLIQTLLLFAYTAKLIYINYIAMWIFITWMGLIGGLTSVNAVYHIRKEVSLSKIKFIISSITIGNILGIVMASVAAIPVHTSLCQLYT